MVADALPRAIRRETARTVSGLEVDILSTTERDRAAATWQTLEESVGAGVADSWDWIETWLNHYGDLVRHRFVVGRGPDGPRGIALIVEGVDQRRGPVPLKTLHLGTAGEPDADTVRVQYNRPLVVPEDRTAFAAAILKAAHRSGLRYSEIVIDGFSPEDLEPFIQVEPDFLLQSITCHVTDLQAIRDAGETVIAALRGGTGNKIRRSRRRLEEAHGPIKVECAETLADAEAIFAEMVTLHQRRWQESGEPGKFASTRFAGFHSDLVRRLFPRGRIFLVRVTAGSVTVGCDYSLIEHGRLLAYQWGLGRFEDSLISPGLVTGAAVMQCALERGLNEFDWLAGDVLYKRQLSTTSRELIWARLPHGIRGHLVDYALRARRYSRRMQNEGEKSG